MLVLEQNNLVVSNWAALGVACRLAEEGCNSAACDHSSAS